jgi:hypothetical protein
LREKFSQHQFCPYEQSQSSHLPFVLVAMKYVKLQQRKKVLGKQEEKQEKHSKGLE